MLEVTVSFLNSHREEYVSERRVKDLRRDPFDEGMKTVQVEDVKDSSG